MVNPTTTGDSDKAEPPTVTVPLPILCLLLLMRPPEWGSGHCLGVEAGVVAAPAGDSNGVLVLSEHPSPSSLPEKSPVPSPTLKMEEKSPITTSSGLLSERFPDEIHQFYQAHNLEMTGKLILSFSCLMIMILVTMVISCLIVD